MAFWNTTFPHNGLWRSLARFDAFQRQWKMEPIITPSFKVGKKMRIELPVGPLVQKSMEKLLKKPTNDGPMITPGF